MSAQQRVTVVGCGHWGKNLVRNFSELDALGAVVDVDRERANKLAAEFDCNALGWEEALGDESLDAVVLATPAETHAKLAQQAIQAGRHVFVEKPLALTLADAEETLALAAEQDVTLMVGHLLQYHPAFLRLRDLVQAGRLGRLQYIYSNRLNFGKIRREEDVFWSFAPHDISMILSLAGEEPEEVWAAGSSYLHKVISDVTTTHLTFSSGVNAHVFVSWLHPFKEQKLVVVGDRGMAVFDDQRPWEQKLQIFAHEVAWKAGIPEAHKADAEQVELEPQEPLRLECQHFLGCIADGSRPRTDGHEGLRVLRVLKRAVEGTKRTVPSNDPRDEVKRRQQDAAGAFVHESSFVDEGARIGAGTKIWHFCHVLGGSEIGRDCIVGQNVMIGPDVEVGDGCKIQNNVSLYKGVVLEDGVFCGPSCVFTNVMNPRAEVERKDEFRPTRVGRGATIGANATIVCGNDLGEYSFVAAGAVVTEAVPAYALVAGVPARKIGWMSRAGERLSEDLVCPRTGERYRLVDEAFLEPVDPEDSASAEQASVVMDD